MNNLKNKFLIMIHKINSNPLFKFSSKIVMGKINLTRIMIVKIKNNTSKNKVYFRNK